MSTLAQIFSNNGSHLSMPICKLFDNVRWSSWSTAVSNDRLVILKCQPLVSSPVDSCWQWPLCEDLDTLRCTSHALLSTTRSSHPTRRRFRCRRGAAGGPMLRDLLLWFLPLCSVTNTPAIHRFSCCYGANTRSAT